MTGIGCDPARQVRDGWCLPLLSESLPAAQASLVEAMYHDFCAGWFSAARTARLRGSHPGPKGSEARGCIFVR